MMRYATTFHLLLLAMITSPTSAEDATAPFVVPGIAQSVFRSRFLDCHSGADAEGSVRFDNLAQIGNEARLKLLNKAQAQLFFELMPPADAEAWNGRIDIAEAKGMAILAGMTVERWCSKAFYEAGSPALDLSLIHI